MQMFPGPDLGSHILLQATWLSVGSPVVHTFTGAGSYARNMIKSGFGGWTAGSREGLAGLQGGEGHPAGGGENLET